MEEHGGNEREDYLAHYGVVGMRWGVRRYQPYSYTGGRRSGRAGKEIGEAAKLGKKAAKAVSKAVGSGAKSVGRAAVNAAKKHNEKKRERRRADLINNGSIKELRRNRGRYLTEDDISKAIERIGHDNKLKDLESEASLKAIRRGKEALGLVKDVASTAWGIYGLGKQISAEMTNKAIDRAVSKDDTFALESILKKTTDRKLRSEIKDAKEEIETREGRKAAKEAIAKMDYEWIRNNPEKLSNEQWDRVSKNLKTQSKLNDFLSGKPVRDDPKSEDDDDDKDKKK